MSEPLQPTPATTARTLLVGAIGAAAGWALSLPVYVLTGPAILVSLLSLFGFRFGIHTRVRDVAFIFIGIGVGSGVNSDVTHAIVTWPFAFLGLGISLFFILAGGRFLLSRFFGFDRRSALLAATPGHLSFVLSMSASLDLNVATISVVQTIRLLALTLIVPFAAIALGIEVAPTVLPPGPIMSPLAAAILFGLSLAVGLVFQRLRAPAALVIGAMVVSATAHLSEIVPGRLSPLVALPCFTIMGTLIGTRFSGVPLARIRAALAAGIAVTALSAVFAIIAALAVAAFLNIDPLHALVAFSPGGLETMIAMGGVLGADPGFVAACHVGRLLMLSFMVPMMLGRTTTEPA